VRALAKHFKSADREQTTAHRHYAGDQRSDHCPPAA
jgi:hypothetical protein